MTGRSPLKQPGVPSKETAAEHARRIAKTRAAYASMSRRGGALHGALRPGSAASDRGAPRDSRGWHFSFAENARDGDDSEDAPPGGSSAFAFATGRTNGHAKSGAGAMRTREKKRETRLEPSVDVLAALAYARGAERAPPRTFAAARDSGDSDDSDDDGVTRASPPTGNLRSRLNRDLSSPDDPLTPSRAWFARSALARSRADSDASDLADEAEEATRRRFRAVAEFEAVARAKRARRRERRRERRERRRRGRGDRRREHARGDGGFHFRFPVRRFRRARRDSKRERERRTARPRAFARAFAAPADAARAARRDGRLQSVRRRASIATGPVSRVRERGDKNANENARRE